MRKCTECKAPVESSIVDNYHFTESGLPNVLLNAVTVYTCTNCGETFTAFANISKLHEAIAIAIARNPAPMSSQEVQYLRKWLRYSNSEFAALMGVQPGQTSRWASGANPIPRTAQQLLRAIVSLAAKGVIELKEFSDMNTDTDPAPYALRPSGQEWITSEVAQA